MDRTWEERQQRPGDAEAVEGMGSITAHKGEHLMSTDYGIMIYRRWRSFWFFLRERS